MKILIVQLRRIGDILLTTPLISYLKSAIPGSIVDFLAEPCGKSVLETHPHLRELLIYDKARPVQEIRRLRARRYDAVLDFLNNPRSAFLTGLTGARWRIGFQKPLRSLFYNVPVPIPDEPEYVAARKFRLADAWFKEMGLPIPKRPSVRPVLYPTVDDERFAEQWMTSERLSPGTFFVIGPAHRHAVRQWAPDRFAAVAQHLAAQGPVYVAWGPGEESVAKQVQDGHPGVKLLPPTTMRQMGSIFKRARLLVTNDSGTMHTAVAVHTPTVTVYGPTRPVDWNPVSAEGNNGNDIAIAGHLAAITALQVTSACDQLLKEARPVFAYGRF